MADVTKEQRSVCWWEVRRKRCRRELRPASLLNGAAASAEETTTRVVLTLAV